MAEGEKLKQTPDTSRLVEKIGKDKVRAIAALGIAAASVLGISGKLNTGVGVGVEVPNPTTGEPISVGVTASSTEGEFPLGLPQVPGKPYKDIEAYSVRIGGAMLTVYTASLEDKNGSLVKTIGVYPGFETLH